VADEVEGPVLNDVKETAVFSRDDKVVILSEDVRLARFIVHLPKVQAGLNGAKPSMKVMRPHFQ